ncbi:MAG: oligosaccharide flippase family protein [Lachnospiraceae bacterium]|nr:oligosaccharide flippase family protein [Lachnospiraceae bacterium]
MIEFFRKHTLIAGTLLLTAAGFASRFLGFFYRIFLSRVIGAEGLGLYQMIFPIFGICFSLCAGSIQTAISRFVAAETDRAAKILRTGFFVSFTLAFTLAFAIWRGADFLAVHILLEPRCAPLLPALALALPCTSIHACICGYYYGMQKVHVPALAQLVEQCTRILGVFLIAGICQEQRIPLTVTLAVAGLAIGEAGSALFTLLAYLLFSQKKPAAHWDNAAIARPLLLLAAPLMANRLVMNLLQSAEAILIPSRLQLFGLTQSAAVSVYGVLTGMAMSFIMFPSAIVNSLAVVLLPSVARAQSDGNDTRIEKSISMSFRYSLYMGILCIGIFTVFGERLGVQVFKNEDAGIFITILAWLCPFLYLATTMGSILNGLGKTHSTFFHNLAALLLRLAFVIFAIPRFGILAYLWGMLASELLLSLLHIFSLLRAVSFSPNVWEMLVKPIFCLCVALGIFSLFPENLSVLQKLPPFLTTVFQMGFVCLGYGLMLLLFHHPRHSSNSTVT